MAQISIGTTAGRRVLGSLNDLASLARFKIADHPAIDLGTLAVDLADTPCAPLNYRPHVGFLDIVASNFLLIPRAVAGRSKRRCGSGGETFVAMTQSTDLREGDHIAARGRLDRASGRAILVE